MMPGIEHMALHMLGMSFATALLIAKRSPFIPNFHYIMHMCLSVYSVCVCLCLWPQRPEEGVRSPWSFSYRQL